MKLKLNEKLAKYGFNTWNFFFKPIIFHALENYLNLDQYGYLRPSVRFFRLRNQNSTSIEIREKMEDLGKKLKTHVSKISLGHGPEISPRGS